MNFGLLASLPYPNNLWKGLGIGPAPPRTKSQRPFGPGTPEESEKSPETVPQGGTPRVAPRSLKESRKSAHRSFKRIQEESESQVLDSFRTFLVPLPGTVSGLFRGSGPEV